MYRHVIDEKSLYQQFTKINNDNFDDFALKLFHFQSQKNKVYRAYLRHIGANPAKVTKIEEIPFLPIEFFKTFVVKTGEWKEEAIFESSGTTGLQTSKHHIKDISFYNKCSSTIFSSVYGDLHQYTFLALLPSYLERGTSSLVYMADHFIRQSRSEFSGFYLNDYEKLFANLQFLKQKNAKVILIGVTFALLQFCKTYPINFRDLMVMETGGMKGRGKEMVRREVHEVLKHGFSVQDIHAEYGMTELLSQAYARQDGRFKCPGWMRVMIREMNDPFQWEMRGRSGGINIIDLANIHSCAFIETKDIGIKHSDGSFEVLGRFDNSEIRGCNLLVV